VLNDPAVAVTVTGSPEYTAGGAAVAVRVTGGAFLHPIGMKTRPADARIKQADCNFLGFIRFLLAMEAKL
jgi:archaellum biogenesis protein FlaJ (TadC family)